MKATLREHTVALKGRNRPSFLVLCLLANCPAVKEPKTVHYRQSSQAGAAAAHLSTQPLNNGLFPCGGLRTAAQAQTGETPSIRGSW